MTDLTREVQCRRTVNNGKDRCPWRGTLDTFEEHTDDTGHEACSICNQPLADDEPRACHECVTRVQLDLNDIIDAYAALPPLIDHSGYHAGRLPGGDALVMAADGSVDGLRPYNPPDDTLTPVVVERPALAGERVTHPAYLEIRLPADGREHFADHWRSDPDAVIAVLESVERAWRKALHHGPADDIATVTSCVDYLNRWTHSAARTVEDFADHATTIRELRGRLQHVAGLADDPEAAPAECFDCGGRLQRGYRPLRMSIQQRIELARRAVAADEDRIAKHRDKQERKHPDAPAKRLRVPARSTRVRHAVGGDDREGLAPTWTCTRCKRSYKPAEYSLALQMRANSISGWVTVRAAAETLRRPERGVWLWVHKLQVPSMCVVATRRVHVDWEATKALSDVTQRRQRQEREAS